MNPSSAATAPAAPACPRCDTQMTIGMISPITNDDGRHVADDISYLCPKCGTEVEREVPVKR